MTITAIVKALVKTGATPEQICAAVEAAESASIAAAEERRKKARDKKRSQRMSRGQSGTDGDSEGQTPPLPDKERSPLHPPKEINPSPPPLSEAIASSSEPRAGTTSAPMARLEFESEFWQHWPHKVGKAKAIEAYVIARRTATSREIRDGLDRYVLTKPPDRPWLNPATFLNQERWNDEPAPIDSQPRRHNGEPAHDTLFRALARAGQECDRDRE